MNTYINFILRFRWMIIASIIALTIFMSMQLKSLVFDGSYRVWFEEGSQSLKDYDSFQATFGNDNSVLILFKDENTVLNPKALHVIERITQKLAKVPHITKSDSLTNYKYIHTDPDAPDDVLVDDFIQNIDTLTPQELNEKAAIIQHEDPLIGRLISHDLKSTMIVGRLMPNASNDSNAALIIQTAIEKIIDEEKASGYTFHLAGGPILDRTFIALGEHDVVTFGPIVLGITMLLLWFIFRQLSAVLLSVSTITLTSIIVLGMQVVLGYKLNNFTANIPIFIIAIGVADSLHLLWVYSLARQKGMDNHTAIHHSIIQNFRPMFLTAITTAVGFMVLNSSNITPIQTLGNSIGMAVFIALFLTLVFVPALLAVVNPTMTIKAKKESEFSKNAFTQNYTHFLIAHNKKIILASILFFSIIALGLSHTNIDSNTVRYFSKDVPFRQTVDFMQTNITGPMSYEIVVDSKTNEGIKSPQFMKTVEQFSSDFKRKYPEVKHVYSLIDIVKKFNEVFNHSKTLPADQNQIAQYLLLYTLSLPQGMEINDQMDLHQQTLRVTAQVNVVDTSRDLEMIHWAQTWWKNTPYSAKVNGQTVMFANMEHDVANTLVQTMAYEVIVASFILLLYFRNFRMIPFVLVPNILPVLLILGTMGWLGISVNLGIAISASIIIGISIDDTVHFLIKYKNARQNGMNLEESLNYVITHSGATIIFTTIILSAAFMIFTFSQFIPNVHFGIVTSIALLFAVAIDLLMLPAMISLYDNKEHSIL